MQRSQTLGLVLVGLTLGAGLALARPAQAQTIDVYQGDVFLGSIAPYDGGALGSVANYAYDPAKDSGFPVNGPTPTGYEGQLYFYQGGDGLSLFMVFNQESAVPLGQGSVDWNLVIAYNATDASVRVSDDPDTGPYATGELGKVSGPTPEFFSGAWAWNSNSDGGVIGELAGNAWVILIDPVSYGGASGLTTLRAYDPTGSYLTLSLATDVSGTIQLKPSPAASVPALPLFAGGLLASALAVLGGRAIRHRRR